MHSRTAVLVLIVFVLGSCGNKAEQGDEVDRKPSAEVAATNVAEPAEPDEKKVELKGNGDEWIPQEHQSGLKKFKDPGVYVDGKIIGILKFGELPARLPIRWHEEQAAVPFKAGDKGPRTKTVRQRRYSFQDYFKLMGVDIKRVKEVHLYGGSKRAIAVVVTGAKLRKHREFAFRFGSDVFGKPIPACPDITFSDGNCPDNLRTIVVYIDKKPPERRGGFFYFDGKQIEGIPYYGEPLRGGVHVYKDGPFAAQIKRRDLESIKGDFRLELPDGSVRYQLLGFLESQGVETGSVVEAWLVHRDRWVKRLSAEELKDTKFAASERGSGQILVGADRVRTNAIALYSKPVAAKDVPRPEPHELHDDRRQ